MDEVDRESKVRHKLRSCNQEENRNDTVSMVSGCTWSWLQMIITSYVRDQTAQEPAESQGPACSDISSQLSPVQYSFRIRVSASDKGGEDDQNNGYAIVAEL